MSRRLPSSFAVTWRGSTTAASLSPMKQQATRLHDPSGKRDRILDAAAALIIEDGLETTMSTIAAHAGVATGSLYNYFQSKEDMIQALYARLACGASLTCAAGAAGWKRGLEFHSHMLLKIPVAPAHR